MKNRLTLKTHADYVAMFGARAPLHEPGAEFRYSNYGMVLLGAIIERVSGHVVLRLRPHEACSSRPA